jgi:hypothetical protein
MTKQTNNITAEVWPADGSDPIEFTGVHYVSFVSSPGGSGEGTYGVPARLVEAKQEGLPVKILYANPANFTALALVRLA